MFLRPKISKRFRLLRILGRYARVWMDVFPLGAKIIICKKKKKNFANLVTRQSFLLTQDCNQVKKGSFTFRLAYFLNIFTFVFPKGRKINPTEEDQDVSTATLLENDYDCPSKKMLTRFMEIREAA